MCFHAACHSAQRFFRHRAGHVAGRRARRAHAPTDRHHPQTLACRARQAAHAVASGGAGTCRLPADSDQHRLAGGSDLRNVWSCFRAPALVKHTQVTIKRGAIRYCNGLADFVFSAQAVHDFVAGNCLAHLWLVPNPAHNPRGDFGLEAGLALNLPASDPRPRYTYSTLGLYRRELFVAPWCNIPSGNPQGVKAALAPLLPGTD